MLVVLWKNILADEEQKRLFLKKAMELRNYILQEPGNRGFDILEEQDNPLEITLCEKYCDEIAIAAHSSMEYAQRYFTELTAITAEYNVKILNCVSENN